MNLSRPFWKYCLLVSFLLAGCKDSSITTQWIPKEKTRIFSSLPTTPQELSYQLPEGWEEQPRSAMRIASFLIKGSDSQSVDVSVVKLAGEAGGDTANINRWRGQISLPILSEKEVLKSVKTISPAGKKMSIVDFSNQGSRVVTAIYKHDGSTWFFKMTGPTPLVEKVKPQFIIFLKSLKLNHEHP